MENISYKMEQNQYVPGQVLIYLLEDKINRALDELKRVDKSNLAIIQDTIKILEEGVEINTKEFQANAFVDLAAPLTPDPKIQSEDLGQIVSQGTVKEIKIVPSEITIPEIKIEDLMNSDNSMFMGGMR